MIRLFSLFEEIFKTLWGMHPDWVPLMWVAITVAAVIFMAATGGQAVTPTSEKERSGQSISSRRGDTWGRQKLSWP